MEVKFLDLTKVGTSLLEMDDIAQYMWLKGVDFTDKNYPDDFNEEETPGFLLRGEKSTDTKKVAGEKASHIAVAFENEDGDVEDRTTVRNAMNLGNIPYTDYVLQTEKAKMSDTISGINKTYLEEFKPINLTPVFMIYFAAKHQCTHTNLSHLQKKTVLPEITFE